MVDRLVWILERFELRARVFQAGPLVGGNTFPAQAGRGYLHVLERGGVRITNAGCAPRRVDAPVAFLYMAPTRHRVESVDADTSMVCATFEFGLGSGNPLLAALPDMTLQELATDGALAGITRQLFGEAGGDHCGRQAILDRLMEVTLILFLRELMDRCELDAGLLAGLADPKLAKSLTALHADPAAPWTLESLAAAAGMSRAGFAARFRDTVGVTPGTYLTNWRIGLAQSLLLKGQAVNVIADAVGYGSASALSRAFADNVGTSPSVWIKRQGDLLRSRTLPAVERGSGKQ